MSLLDVLLKVYTFQELLRVAYSVFGGAGLLTLVLSYVAILVYLASTPRRTFLSREITKVYISPFVVEACTLLCIVFAILSALYYLFKPIPVDVFISVLLLAIEAYASTLLHMSWRKMLSYDGYQAMKVHAVRSLLPSIITCYRLLVCRKSTKSGQPLAVVKDVACAQALSWIAIAGLGLYLILCNPSLPLTLWILTMFLTVALGATLAIHYATAFHTVAAPYITVKLVNGIEYKGFLVARDEGHFIIKTPSKDIVVLESQIKEISLDE